MVEVDNVIASHIHSHHFHATSILFCDVRAGSIDDCQMPVNKTICQGSHTRTAA